MNVKLDQEKQPLLSRTLVTGVVEFEQAPPKNDEIIQSIASQLKTEEKVVVMKKIDVIYGNSTAKIEAYVYDSLDEKDRIQKKTKFLKEAEKKAAEEAKKAAEEAAKAAEEAKAPEAPVEEAAPSEEKSEDKAEESKEESAPAKEAKEEAPTEEKKEE